MSCTLISIIGTGMYKFSNEKNKYEGYIETEYIYPDGKSSKTRLFLQSLLETKYRDINQIILIGTKTSSWDCLIDIEKDERDEVLSLWTNLFDECEKSEKVGISDSNIILLQEYLSNKFSVPVTIKVHTQNIDDNSITEVFECYSSVTNEVNKNNDILFDITHGYRSMPVLLYQTLQYSVSSKSNHKVELVYGELDLTDKSKGYARNLNKYWQYSELTEALNLFESKIDGFKLAELLSQTWPKGSKAIKSLSEIVQTNFALQFIEVLKQIKNAIAAYPKDAPKWLEPVKTILENILKLKDNNSISRTLFNYAQFLYNLQLNVQAIITLQVCVETAIVSNYGNEESDLGNYDWWQTNGKKCLQNIKNSKNYHEIGKPLKNLEHFRNQIAHGGGKNNKQGYPAASNIPCIYSSAIRGVENLLKELNL